MRPRFCNTAIFLAFIIGLSPLFFNGCFPNNNRTLDPAGVYEEDKLLYDFDGIIVEWTRTCKEVVALADRNAAFVAARPELAAKVAKIRAEIDGVPGQTETLTRLHLVRDAYLVAKAANAGELRKEIATARTALDAARALLPLFTSAAP